MLTSTTQIQHKAQPNRGEPTENIIYLGHVASMSMKENLLKTFCRKNEEEKTNLKPHPTLQTIIVQFKTG